MIPADSRFQPKGNLSLRRLVLVGSLLILTLLFTGARANARPVHFHYNGGRWSHTRHAGWHRYWGGPSIGFYWAPAPVYVVSGYSSPSYYTGTRFWYSNPSFGLSINLGGGGGHYYYGRRVVHRVYHHGYHHR